MVHQKIMISWIPTGASIKEKLSYSLHKAKVTAFFPGLQHDFVVDSKEEVKLIGVERKHFAQMSEKYIQMISKNH